MYGIRHRRVTPLWPQANGEIEIQNHGLMKRIQIACAENKNWRVELHAYLLMYRSTPHSTTSVSPAELLHNHKIHTKLPELNSNFNAVNDESVRDHDAVMKDKGRRYSDKKRSATYCDIFVSVKVFLKQAKNDKGSTSFAKDPFVVIWRNGSSVVIENEKGHFKRNITHVKKINYVESNDNIANQSDFACKNDVLPKV